MKRYLFTFIALVMGVVNILSPFKVMADVTTDPTLSLSYASGEGVKIQLYVDSVDSYTQELAEYDLLEFELGTGSDKGKVDTGTLTMKMSLYKGSTQALKSKMMEYALNSIESSSMSTITKNKVYNFISSQDESTSSLVRQLSTDVNADFADAYLIFKPFSGVIGTILGVFVIAIFLTITFMVLVDISYISIPIVKDFLTPDNANARPKFVSNEAWYAIKEVETANSKKKEVLFVYLKSKSIQFFALSICILYLVSGEIYNLIGSMMDAFSGIVG